MDFTQKDLKKLFHYNPETGVFTRLTQPCNSVKIGDTVGHISKVKNSDLRYYLTQILGKHYKLHRLAFLYMTGEFPEQHVDHIDGNGLNNKWENLRDVTRSQNGRNRKININNNSGYPGVSYFKQTKKWRAAINIEKGTKKHLGYFDSFEEAKVVRIEAEKQTEYVRSTHDNKLV